MIFNTKHALAGVLLAAAAFNTHATDTIKVFFLAGQSNMAGNGMVEAEASPGVQKPGTLRDYVNTNPADYGHLVDGLGNWTTRSDVWMWNRVGNASGTVTTTTTGDHGVTYGAVADRFGPEVGIGKVLGDHYDEQVVLIKTAWGGKSLYQDFRPPSAGALPTSVTDALSAAGKDDSYGNHYNLMVAGMQEALVDIAAQYAGQTIEIEGLFWNQGWNDRSNSTRIDTTTSPETWFNDLAVAEYESNLNHLIADLRSELSTPDLKVVIGTTGMGPDSLYEQDDPPHFNQNNKTLARALVAAQTTVGDADANATTVDTHPFWRDSTLSPNNEIEHWNRNGESYYLIGESMGEAMISLVPSLAGDLDLDGDVDGVDVSGFFSAFTGPGGVTSNPATDLDGDGDTDGVDIANVFAFFTGPLAPANVPEPTSLALMGVGGLLFLRRRGCA